jgi:integrase
MARITKRAVDALAAGRFLWDGRFGVKATATGSKVFILQYRTGRRLRRYTLGRHGAPWTVDTARKEANRLLVLVGSGVDPMATKITARTAPTLSELAERFMTEHVAAKRKPSTARLYRGLLDTIILPALGRRAVNGITRADVSTLHHRHRATPTHANRMLLLVSKLMNHAERLGLRPDGSNPVRHVERFPERPRQRFLSDDELKRLGKALARSEESIYVKAAVALLILTGCRRGEILGLRWSDVDLERGVVALRDAKTGPRTVYLNPPAVRVLAGLPREEGNPAVIVGRSGPRVNITKAWYSIRKTAKLTDVRLHDLRHSFASVGAAGGLSLPAIGALLGHSQAQTTKRYSHLVGAPMRQAAALIGTRIDEAMNGATREPIDSVGALVR